MLEKILKLHNGPYNSTGDCSYVIEDSLIIKYCKLQRLQSSLEYLPLDLIWLLHFWDHCCFYVLSMYIPSNICGVSNTPEWSQPQQFVPGYQHPDYFTLDGKRHRMKHRNQKRLLGCLEWQLAYSNSYNSSRIKCC